MISPETVEEVRRRIEEKFLHPRHGCVHAPNDLRTRDKIRGIVEYEIRKAVELGEAPKGLFQFAVFQDPTNPNSVTINVWRNFTAFPMTRSEFFDWFNRAPEDDELHRINCGEAGEVGHFHCGWCPRHSIGRWACGCLPSMDPLDRGTDVE